MIILEEQGKRGEFLSLDHIFFFSFGRARIPPTRSTLERVQTAPAPLCASVRTVRSSERVATGARRERENVFKIFPLEISTVSRPPGAYQKKSTKRRERSILRCRDRRATTSFRRPDCPSKQKFVSLDLQCTRASVKKSKGRSKKNAPPGPQRLAFPFPQERPLPP